jgi:N-acetylglutamate synthase-like GNAT family acetyltransferase
MNIQRGKYLQYKGYLYEVTGTAHHSETLEDIVIYKALYGNFEMWVQPLKMFLEDIEVNGKIQKRFEFIGDGSSKEIQTDTLKSHYKLFEATSDEIEILEDRLDKFNLEQLSFVGDMEIKKNYLIKNKTGDIVAGIRGCFYLEECLFISMLFIDEDKRKQGFGSILLKTIEEQARSMKIRLIHLDTFDFQAKDFYLKHGYEIFGVLNDCPKGHKRFYMKKVLSNKY